MQLRAPTVLALALSLLAAPPAATVQTRPDSGRPAAADSAAIRAYDLPAMPLDAAIARFREQSGLLIEPIDLATIGLRGLMSRTVNGSYTGAEALRLLLDGTGVTARFTSASSAVLRSPNNSLPQALAAIEIIESRRIGYAVPQTTTATKTRTPLRDVPQSVSIVSRDLIADAGMRSMADVARFIPGITMGQGEGNRDQPTIRGNNTTADFFLDGVRDDVQYFRDLYNVERVEALKGSNAMIFGRGGGGGILNRVTKEAGWTPLHELTLQGGSYDARRANLDVGGGLTHAVAGRLNGMVESSDMFRRNVSIDRYGINPTLTIGPGAQRTRITLGYELFSDRRTADRGIPSFQGRPVAVDIGTFFGDPDASWSDLRSHTGMATVTHEATERFTIRNRTQVASYDKFYQNVYPGSVTAAGDEVSISAYNNETQRLNLFNQTDATLEARTGRLGHTLLIGAEVGRQATDNRRLTGYFDNTATSVLVPVSAPTISRQLTFRAGSSDADNEVTNTVASVYVQDQVAVGEHLQLIAGVRYEHFDLEFRDRREGKDTTLNRPDDLVSPRFGVVVKPVRALSLYASHSVSFLPSAGDQFASLDTVTTHLDPERFTNDEVGVKWDLSDRIALTGAAYRLDRTNTRGPSSTTGGVIVQTGRQRSSGWELGAGGSITSAWEVMAAYANQRATITEPTAAVTRKGARVPLVPRTTASLWNRVQLGSHVGVGVGLNYRSDMFTGFDNTVTLPGYTEVNGALFVRLGRHVRAQANVQNLFDEDHYDTAHNNNNITPGTPRSFRISLTTGF